MKLECVAKNFCQSTGKTIEVTTFYEVSFRLIGSTNVNLISSNEKVSCFVTASEFETFNVGQVYNVEVSNNA
jgi:hypothetical protein